jgi:hypothetical protein
MHANTRQRAPSFSDVHVAEHPVERGRQREVDGHGGAARAHRVLPRAHHAVPEPRLGADVHVHRQLPARPLPLGGLQHVARQRAGRRLRGHVDARLVPRRLQEPRRGGAREVLAVVPHADVHRVVRHLGALVPVVGAQREVERARQRAGLREVEPGRGRVVDGELELRRVEEQPDQDDDGDDEDHRHHRRRNALGRRRPRAPRLRHFSPTHGRRKITKKLCWATAS